MAVTTKVSLSLPDPLLAELREHAEGQDWSLTEVVRRAVRLYLRVASHDDIVIRDADTGTEKTVWLL